MKFGNIESQIGRALARSHPWLFKLHRLPDQGLPDLCMLWHPGPAANDARYDPQDMSGR